MGEGIQPVFYDNCKWSISFKDCESLHCTLVTCVQCTYVHTCACVCVVSCFSLVRLFVTLWTVGSLQAPLSMGFSKQEYWSGLPFPLPGNLPNTGIQPVQLMSPTLASGFFTTSAILEAHYTSIKNNVIAE